MNAIDVINLCVNAVTLFVLFMLLVGTLLGGSVSEKTTRWFVCLLVLIILAVIVEVITAYMGGTTSKAAGIVVRISSYIGYLSWALQGLALSYYLYEYTSIKTRISKKPFYIIAFFAAMGVLLATIAQFNHMYGFFDEYNRYQQKETFWIAMVFPGLILLMYSIIVLQNIKNLKIREWASFLSYVVIYIVLYIISYLNPELWIAYIGDAVAMFMIYINIQVELKQQLKEKQLQLDESRIAIMLSQIQPHFLYNSLTSISVLCKENPKANKAILYFSQYLRGNMDSLSQTKPICFEDELKHTQQYLWLEELRFGEKLSVEYDIKVTKFMLPVLTLQPIVENAVRHGLTKKEKGGTVIIRTRETESSYTIIVEDDGVGFDMNIAIEDGKSHMGIENVRNRLAAMCSGKLEVESMPGKGTIATIEIPKKKKGRK